MDGVLLLVIVTMLLVKLLERTFFLVLANDCGSSVALNRKYVVEVCREFKRKPQRRALLKVFSVFDKVFAMSVALEYDISDYYHREKRWRRRA